MPRMISFSMTWRLLLEGVKTVTRRDYRSGKGWSMLRPGDVLQAVDYLPSSLRPWRKICRIKVISVSVERLGLITPAEVALEGFRDLTPSEFVEIYCAPVLPDPDRMVVRIEFEVLPESRS